MKKLTEKQVNALATVLDMAEDQQKTDVEQHSIARSTMGEAFSPAFNLKAQRQAIRIVSNLWLRAKKERGLK